MRIHRHAYEGDAITSAAIMCACLSAYLFDAVRELDSQYHEKIENGVRGRVRCSHDSKEESK